MTLLALAVGTLAILVFSGYVADTVHGLQTATVRSIGHLQVVSKGYLEFGRANPSRFAITDYKELIEQLRSDAALAEHIHVITPTLSVEGVAGNFKTNSSTSFAGEGIVPKERALQLSWDGFAMRIPPVAVELSEDRKDSGIIGHGMAQLLGLCDEMGVEGCRVLQTPADDIDANAQELQADIASLSDGLGTDPHIDTTPYIDLLSSSSNGSPNVVRMELASVQRQAIRQVDSMFIAMPLSLAQRLTFGPNGQGASSIIVQVNKTSQMAAVKTRIEEIITKQGLNLEVLNFHQISSVYDQVVQNYNMIFQFIATLIGIITVFSIANAVNMAVSERTSEIGTLRAIGFQKGAVRNVFIAEGLVLGVLGTLLGTVLAIVFAEAIINLGGFSWTPPGRSVPIPIRVDIFANPNLIPLTIVGLSLMAAISSAFPSAKAARTPITEALRHA